VPEHKNSKGPRKVHKAIQSNKVVVIVLAANFYKLILIQYKSGVKKSMWNLLFIKLKYLLYKKPTVPILITMAVMLEFCVLMV
jgi:hypothetical protein